MDETRKGNRAVNSCWSVSCAPYITESAFVNVSTQPPPSTCCSAWRRVDETRSEQERLLTVCSLSVRLKLPLYLQRLIQVKNKPLQSAFLYCKTHYMLIFLLPFLFFIYIYLVPKWWKGKIWNEQVYCDLVNNLTLNRILMAYVTPTAGIILDLQWHLVAASWPFASPSAVEWTSVWHAVCGRKLHFASVIFSVLFICHSVTSVAYIQYTITLCPLSVLEASFSATWCLPWLGLIFYSISKVDVFCSSVSFTSDVTNGVISQSELL